VSMRTCFALVVVAVGCGARAAELPTLAGPAMGTTYRVTLGAIPPDLSRGEVHREIEAVLARIDQAANTWRQDSDASRFNRAAAGEWVTVAGDLVAIVEIARDVHARSNGAFDITIAPLLRLPPGDSSEAARAAALARVGMQHVESRASPAALRKQIDGVEIDLGGIGPGYAVDRIGGRLVELGSASHLVELGGEVRAWGTRPDGTRWRVRLRGQVADDSAATVVELAPGEAIATATSRPGRSPIDPRTGSVVKNAPATVSIRAASCAEADAGAVAALVQPGVHANEKPNR
jgi:thiamine biosynthesis lipoprotein